jgi:hypothetical protein
MFSRYRPLQIFGQVNCPRHLYLTEMHNRGDARLGEDGVEHGPDDGGRTAREKRASGVRPDWTEVVE